MNSSARTDVRIRLVAALACAGLCGVPSLVAMAQVRLPSAVVHARRQQTPPAEVSAAAGSAKSAQEKPAREAAPYNRPATLETIPDLGASPRQAPVREVSEQVGPLLLPRFDGTIEEFPADEFPVDEFPVEAIPDEGGSTPTFAPLEPGDAEREPAGPRLSAPVTEPTPESTRPEYWIISSRRCPQQGRRQHTSCRFETYSVAAGNRPVSRNNVELKQWLQPRVPVCILVHGSLTGWPDVVRDGQLAWKWVDQANPARDIQFLIFSWPSSPGERGTARIDFEFLGRRAAFNGFYLAQLVAGLPPDTPVCLIGHSHGARVVASAVHLLGGGRVQGYSLPHLLSDRRRIRTVFLAGAVDKNWLNPGERYCAVLPRAELLVNLINRSDPALGFYPLTGAFSQTALGESGFTHREARVLGPLTQKIRQIDATPVVGQSHVLASWVERPEISRTIAPLLHFDQADESRAADVTRQLRQYRRHTVQYRGNRARRLWQFLRIP